MNEVFAPDAAGVLSKPDTLTFQRLLPGPVERVWRHLTVADLRRKWLADGDMEEKAGAGFELVWRNDTLSSSAAARPPGFAEEQRMASRIVSIEPPRHLEFTWGADGGTVTIDLAEAGDRVLLTLRHTRVKTRDDREMIGAGWHTHLDILAASLAQATPPSFWDRWNELRKDYSRSLPA